MGYYKISYDNMILISILYFIEIWEFFKYLNSMITRMCSLV